LRNAKILKKNFKILKTFQKKFERKEKFFKKFFEKSENSQKNFKILGSVENLI
jgi:hypothetical protein